MSANDDDQADHQHELPDPGLEEKIRQLVDPTQLSPIHTGF